MNAGMRPALGWSLGVRSKNDSAHVATQPVFFKDYILSVTYTSAENLYIWPEFCFSCLLSMEDEYKKIMNSCYSCSYKIAGKEIKVVDEKERLFLLKALLYRKSIYGFVAMICR